jgi:hypothetical protein
MVKPSVSPEAAERKLAAAFTALESELSKLTPAASKKGAAEEACRALNDSIARLRQAVGKV